MNDSVLLFYFSQDANMNKLLKKKLVEVVLEPFCLESFLKYLHTKEQYKE